MSAELITAAAELSDLCRALESSDWIALDTEFLRERTYSARLCLVQVATPELIAIVDPLALESLAPLSALLNAPRPRKVLHAARQDLEVFHDIERRVPAPIFDTQIAAAYLGYDDQIGYAALVAALTGVTLDKAHTRTDWSQRPLSAAQLQYAADDVRYLRPVYETLFERLESRHRLDWVEEDCLRLTDPALYANDPELAWRRLRGGGDLPPARQQALRALAVWREREAQERNLPRAWVVRDETLFDLVHREPSTAQELHGIRGLEDSARRRHGDKILAVLETARHADPVPLWPPHSPLLPGQAALVKQFMAAARTVAEAAELAPAVLATRRDIEQLVRGAALEDIFSGWRADMLRAPFTPLLDQVAAPKG
ncbi:MAG: ribonuclease D [Gammaproteobacteria bacterium]|nr:ribonuclease D [Gammaproteobacteria bacterium]